MAEPFDAYVDQVQLGGSAYGVTMNFGRSPVKPVAPGSVPHIEDVGAIRMSLEHFKLMTFLMKRHIEQIEGQLGIQVTLPLQLLNSLQIGPEDWTKFWKQDK